MCFEFDSTSAQQSSSQKGVRTSAAMSTDSTNVINPKKKSSTKKFFRRLVKQYLESHVPPTKSDVLKLMDLKEGYSCRDIIEWRDQMGIKKKGLRLMRMVPMSLKNGRIFPMTKLSGTSV